MSIKEHAEEPAKRIDLYVSIGIGFIALISAFVMSVTSWNSINYRLSAVEQRTSATESANANEDKQLRIINRNLVRLGAKLGIEMENPE